MLHGYLGRASRENASVVCTVSLSSCCASGFASVLSPLCKGRRAPETPSLVDARAWEGPSRAASQQGGVLVRNAGRRAWSHVECSWRHSPRGRFVVTRRCCARTLVRRSLARLRQVREHSVGRKGLALRHTTTVVSHWWRRLRLQCHRGVKAKAPSLAEGGIARNRWRGVVRRLVPGRELFAFVE